MKLKNALFRPWFYFLLSLVHQVLVILGGPFPNLFPDSGTYQSWHALTWHDQRMPLYPFLIWLSGDLRIAAGLQIFVFALAGSVFFQILQILIAPRSTSDLPIKFRKFAVAFPWVPVWGALYFVTNFELTQYSPTILTESFGISLFIFYFYSAQRVQEHRLHHFLTFFVFPLLLVFLRPSFILVPFAISGFLILRFYKQRLRQSCAVAVVGVAVYSFGILGYAVWNKARLGHVGLSDIPQHQIMANYMAQGVLAEEAAKPEASRELHSFGEAYSITGKNPALKDSQYSMFEQWQLTNPNRDLYHDLLIANRELLTQRPLSYLAASLRNLSVLIDGKASFNYFQIQNRGFFSNLYFLLQQAADQLFAILWLFCLFRFIVNFRKRDWFATENFLFLMVASQFLTIAFFGYSELRRQSVGVAAAQIAFVWYICMDFLDQRRRVLQA